MVSKKLFTILSALGLFMMSISSVSADFSDVGSDEFYQSGILFLSSEGIVNGNPDGTFRPRSELNRAEMLKIAIEAAIKLGLFSRSEVDGYATVSCFQDVPANQWFTKYVCFAKAKNFVMGYDNGKFFRPSQSVSFVEGLKMSQKSFGKDFDESGDVWYRDLVDSASEDNLIPITIRSFNVALLRGEMADMITRYIKFQGGLLNAYLGERADVVVNFITISKGYDMTANDGDVIYDGDDDVDDSMEVVFKMDEQNGSGQSGTVTLTKVDNNETEAVIEINPPELDNDFGGDIDDFETYFQPAHIHVGSCPNPGTVLYPLENLIDGMSITILNISLEDLLKQNSLAVNVHKNTREVDVYVACGNLN